MKSSSLSDSSESSSSSSFEYADDSTISGYAFLNSGVLLPTLIGFSVEPKVLDEIRDKETGVCYFFS